MKLRGFRSCVSTAIRAVFGNLTELIKENWKMLLPLIVVMAALRTCFDNIMPGMMYVGFEFKGLQLMIISVLSLITYFLAYAVAYSIINKQGVVWNIKRLLWLLPVNIAFAMTFVILGIVAGLIYTYFCKNPAQIPILNIIVVFLLASPIAFIFCLPVTFVNCRYMMEPELKLRKSFGESYAAGMRNWGFIFITYFVATLCSMLICAVLCSPSIIIQTVLNVSSYGTAAYGDQSGLPLYFMPLDFIISLYSSTVYMIILLFVTFTGYYVYQTVSCRLIARKEMKNHTSGNDGKP